ncbi:hypothetical protein [Aquimarina sp. Aq78]|uniref:hypothetical protein n=1 Tax=Aquimarina sp. Aq78 TaxID=1191889 RepID=UPI000D0EBA9D|nr:hypothetical protein [Aquimarina sp. Aq78]
MSDFEELKNDWKSVNISNTEMSQNPDSLLEKLKKLNKKILFSNLLTSILFAPTFIVLGWLWSAYDSGTPLFYGSLLSMGILLLITLVILWYRVLFWKTPELNKNVTSFARIMIKKLSYYKWITSMYMPVYLILLASILFVYFRVVLKGASFWFSFWAYTLTFCWVLIVGFISMMKKVKKNKKEIDPVLQDLRQIKEML